MTIISQVNLTGARKQPMVGHNKRNSVPDDIPIRLAVTFAPSRARVIQGQCPPWHVIVYWPRNCAHYLIFRSAQWLLSPDQEAHRLAVCDGQPRTVVGVHPGPPA